MEFASLFANSTAILTDAFPANQRGTALGINSIAAIAGSFLGLLLGGVLGPVNWHLVFLVSAPIGVFGTVWAYFMLKDIGVRKHARMDWWGNILFAAGLIAILVGITYGLLPYGGHPMGWTNPWVLTAIFGGVALLVVFGFVETKVAEPLFRLSLFRIRAVRHGQHREPDAGAGPRRHAVHADHLAAGHLAAAARLQLQPDPAVGGHLPGPADHRLPALRAAVRHPVRPVRRQGVHRRRRAADRADLPLLLFLPVNFTYWEFALIIALNGFGSGLFASPNRAEMMNAVPANQRGAAGGMIATFHEHRVRAVHRRLLLADGGRPVQQAAGRACPAAWSRRASRPPAAQQISHLPPIGVLFAAFLGYNPMQQLLGPLLGHLPAGHAAYVTGRQFFPHLITGPFHDGLGVAFAFAIAASLIAAVASAAHRPAARGRDARARVARRRAGRGGRRRRLRAQRDRRDGQEAQETRAPAGPRGNGQSPAVTKSAGTEPG